MEIRIIISKLAKIKNKMPINIGGLPSNEIERDIFSKLDLIDDDFYSELNKFEKNKDIFFDLDYIEENVREINKLIIERGDKKFKENKKLSNWYNFSFNAFNLMKQFNRLNKKGGKKWNKKNW